MNFEPHTKIKEEGDDTSNIIDLDLDKSPEDLVYEWDSKVRYKIKNYVVVDSEQSLDMLMKWYIKVIKEEVINFEDYKTLKLFTANHLQFFKLYFIELNCCFVDNYLDNMEEILSFYVNLEIKSLPVKQKDGNKRAYKKLMLSICRKIISMLNIYLLNREDRMCHVIMKVKLNLPSEDSKDLLNLLYGNFLTKRPKDKSDLEFCRAYILYQKWKTIRKSDDWEKMDEVMYNLYERTPDSVKSNPVLKQILLPQNNSILDTLIHISEKHLIISDEYFKYIKSNKIQEDNTMSSAMCDIEMQDDDIIPDLIGDTEDQEFEKAYKSFVKSMSSIYLENDGISEECMAIKVESASEDEDCQIVAVSSVGNDPEGAEVIHEILDDDEDDIEIIYVKRKDEKQNISQEDNEKRAKLSFLESIKVPESRDASTERVTSSTNSRCTFPTITNNLIETSSSNSEIEIADSPTSNPIDHKLSSDTSKTNVVTSVAQTEPVQEAAPVELCKGINTDSSSTYSSCREKNKDKTEATDETSKSNSCPAKKKNVVSIETQTDEWHLEDSQDKLPSLEKHTEQNSLCRSYYYYGLDTPPSDQPPDEHIPPVTESTSYPNVYANIVRSHSPDENDRLAKATETDSLSSSLEDNDMDNNKSSSTSSVDLAPTLEAQNKSNDLNDCSSRRTNEYNPNLLDAAFIPDVEPNTKKKHKNLNRPPDLDLCSSQQSPISRICLSEEENIVFCNEVEHTSNDFQLNETTRESCSVLVSKGRSSPQEHTADLHNVSSLDLSINEYHRTADTYSSCRGEVRSPSPFKYRDGDIPEISTNACTSTDFIVTSAEPNSIVFNDQGKPADVSSASPDVTSTSTDVQDFNESLCSGDVHTEENQLIYHHLSADMCDIENHTLNNESYCSEEYVEYSEYNGNVEFGNNENVTQSNIEDGEEEEIYIEGPILMTHGEELTYIVHESLPVGANVNICTEEPLVYTQVSKSVTDVDYQNDTGPEIETEKCNQSAIPTKELKVSVEKIEVNPCKNNNITTSSPRKIMFTSTEKVIEPSLDDFSKFEEKIHMRFSNFKDTQDLDDIFCGPVSKINDTNGCINFDTNFDLFNSKSSTSCGSRTSNNPSAPSANEVISPAYEGMDDFRIYFEENKNNSIEVSPIQGKTDTEQENLATTIAINLENNCLIHSVSNNKVNGLLVPKTLRSLQDVSESSSSSKLPVVSAPTDLCSRERTICNSVKKVKIADTIMDSRNSVPQLSPEHSEIGVLRSILKNPLPKTQKEQEEQNQEEEQKQEEQKQEKQKKQKQENSMRKRKRRDENGTILLEEVNIASFKRFKVNLSDEKLRGFPIVLLGRLSDNVVSAVLKMSERSRNVRQEKQQTQQGAVKPIKVDYNKETSQISIMEFNANGRTMKMPLPETCQDWRSNSVPHTKSSRLDEDTTKKLIRREGRRRVSSKSLNYCNIAKSIPSLNNSDNSDIDVDVNLNSFIDKNLNCQSVSNITSNLNLCHFNGSSENQQPAVVPEVAEFEKTFKLEEVVKMSPIPSDLHNLNLQKFSPSPIMHCLSPQSDSLSHTFLSDPYLNDKSSLVSEVISDVKIQGYNEIEGFVKQTESLNNETININDTYSANTENLDLNNFKSNFNQDLNLSSTVPDEIKLDTKSDPKETSLVSKEDIKSDIVTKTNLGLPENESETRLPLKKRKHSVANTKEEIEEDDDDFLGPDLVEEIIKRARAEEIEKEDISYPAKPMISIAEIQEKLVDPHPRVFKTPAERKEMPPPPSQSYMNSVEAPKIITEQYNNHTYNNPTINYHMNNVPYPFFPCGSLPYFPPILLPLNSTTTFDMNLVPAQQQPHQHSSTVAQASSASRLKRDRKAKGRKKN